MVQESIKLGVLNSEALRKSLWLTAEVQLWPPCDTALIEHFAAVVQDHSKTHGSFLTLQCKDRIVPPASRNFKLRKVDQVDSNFGFQWRDAVFQNHY